MNISVSWQDQVHFVGETSTQKRIDIDGPEALGGQNKGARPMELLLMSLGSCMSVDVVHLLKKARQQVTDCRVDIKANRAETIPSVFTDIHLHFHIAGTDLSEPQVTRILNLSLDKYCSVSQMLRQGGVKITQSYALSA